MNNEYIMPDALPSPVQELVNCGRFLVPVLYLDNHLLVVEKPPNMPVQQDSSKDLDLLSAMKGYIAHKFSKPGAAYLGLCHRLDRPVGGAMVLARTSKAAARLSAAFASGVVGRRYLAVVRGQTPEQMQLVDYLIKNARTATTSVTTAETPGAKRAELVSHRIAAREGLSLQVAQLLTGRSHQIRVQHAHAGFPLWGDGRYGGGKPGQQIALWAAALEFEHPTLKEKICFVSMPPQKGVWSLFESELKGGMEYVQP